MKITDISFEEKVRKINWDKYLEPEYYSPQKMYYNPERPIKALIRLSRYDNSEDESLDADVCSEIRFAIGNDHRGTYYPAALEGIDLIIEILKHSKLEAARRCAAAVLNDLYYFQLELGSSDKPFHDAIETIIRDKLRPYSDENITSGRESEQQRT